MLGIIIIIYVVAFFAFWGIQAIKALPTFFRWALLILALPVLFPVGMVTSLPEYLKKDGKMYKYRSIVYFTFFMFALIIFLVCLPA